MTSYGSNTTSVTTAKRFKLITPSDVTTYSADESLRALYIMTNGNLSLTDHDDNATGVFAVVGGQTLYMAPKKVNAATTCAVLGLFV